MNFNELRKQLTPAKKNQPIFKNLTAKYLFPQVRLLSDEFLHNLESTKWSAIGLCDRNYPSYNEFDNKLFMLAHNDSDLTYWLDTREYYLYPDGEMNKLMIIIELPINNRSQFLEGRYSELYEEDVKDNVITKYVKREGIEYITDSWQVVNKTEERRILFQNGINEYFKPEPKIIVTKDQEYEYPPVLTREIFNESLTI